MRRVAGLHVSPKLLGGAETAFEMTVQGINDLGVRVDSFGFSKSDGRDWPERVREYVIPIHPQKDDVQSMLAPFDGLVLSDFYGESGDALKVVLSMADIPLWTSGRHDPTVSRKVMDRHQRALISPSFSRRYVSFWSQTENLPDVEYVRGVLPYRLRKDLHGLPPLSKRPIDFGFVGRTTSWKGPLTFVSALEAMTRIDERPFQAVISGSPIQVPGGPYIGKMVAPRLEEWGWKVHRREQTMKSTWSATHPRTGSVIWYTGAYTYEGLPDVLKSIKCFINTTHANHANGHLEFSTMEAMDAGCAVIAPMDWADWHYDPASVPTVVPVPEQSYRIQKGKREVFVDKSIDAPDTTYKPFGELLVRALNRLHDQGIDRMMEPVVDHNRRVLTHSHDPKRSGDAHLRALDGKR